MQAVEPTLTADGATIEVAAGNVLRVKDGGLAATKLAAASVDDSTLERYDSGGGVYKLRIKDAGITAAKMATGVLVKTVINCGNASVGASQTRYSIGDGVLSATRVVKWLVPTAGNIKNLRVYATGDSAGGTTNPVITVGKNGVDTALTCSPARANGTMTASDLVNTVAVAAGDYLDVKIVAGDACAVNNLSVSFELVS